LVFLVFDFVNKIIIKYRFTNVDISREKEPINK